MIPLNPFPILCIFLWAILPGCPAASHDPAFSGVKPVQPISQPVIVDRRRS